MKLDSFSQGLLLSAAIGLAGCSGETQSNTSNDGGLTSSDSGTTLVQPSTDVPPMPSEKPKDNENERDCYIRGKGKAETKRCSENEYAKQVADDDRINAAIIGKMKPTLVKIDKLMGNNEGKDTKCVLRYGKKTITIWTDWSEADELYLELVSPGQNNSIALYSPGGNLNTPFATMPTNGFQIFLNNGKSTIFRPTEQQAFSTVETFNKILKAKPDKSSCHRKKVGEKF